jgi:hypothetical protein
MCKLWAIIDWRDHQCPSFQRPLFLTLPNSFMTTVQPTTTHPAPSATLDSEPDPTNSLLAQSETLRDSLSRALSDTRDLISAIQFLGLSFQTFPK